MRVGKKPNVGDKKTRSCVVRLEKVAKHSPNVSPSPEENRSISRTNRLNTTAMGATPKGRRGGMAPQQEDKANSKTTKKKFPDSSTTHSNFQTQQQQKAANIDTSNIRSNQKVKIVSRSIKTTPATTPPRDETPPPTIAAGRSRRAIKPNPKYASEDIVTSKVVRNVGMVPSSASRGGSSGHSRTRKDSSSSDDFYNRNSDDEYENDSNNLDDEDDNMDNDDDFHDDKAYQASDKDEHDSDYSVVEEPPARISKLRGQSKKSQEPFQSVTPQTYKVTTQISNVKRTSATTPVSSTNLRSAPSQLQQIRRSLASANAQRNLNLLAGSSSTPQKRKLEDVQDISDSDSSYPLKRKQLLLSNSSGLKVKVPVRENRINAASTPITKTRFVAQTQTNKVQQLQPVNGCKKINNTQITSRQTIEIEAKSNSEAARSLKQTTVGPNTNKLQIQNPITTQAKMLASKTHRFRSGSPKLPVQKEKQNNGLAISISPSSSSASLNVNSKISDKGKTLTSRSAIKSKTATSSHKSAATRSDNVHEIKDDSPNSTMDDFETMPTFTIVNVNDIINKKGDVLITKTKSNKTPTVIEFSESISLDDDEGDDNDGNDDVEEVEEILSTPPQPKQGLSKKLGKVSKPNNRKDFENKQFSLIRSNEPSNHAPQILNHKFGIRNARVSAKTTTTLTATLTSPDKPAPRILNSVVAKKTQPVKPMIANMDDSADESFPLSLDEDEDEDAEDEADDDMESRINLAHMPDKAGKREYQNLIEVDNEDTESQNTEEDDTVLPTRNSAATNTISSKILALTSKQITTAQRRRRGAVALSTPFTVSSNKKRMGLSAAKENSLAATNQQLSDTVTNSSKQTDASTIPIRKANAEKIVISKQGDKIIKKITCFETWYVINMPIEPKRPMVLKNQLEMALIRLANNAKNICLPNDMWSCKVTLYELSPQTLAKGTFATYTGDLYEHNISEEDRCKYQPSCVMFRRSIGEKQVSRMPYDRAVIFKNKTFYTNIEGKNVRLVGAPCIINNETEIEILLEVMDSLTLQSDFVEHISIVQ